MSDGCSSGSVSAGVGAANTMGIQFMQAISPSLTLGGKYYILSISIVLCSLIYIIAFCVLRLRRV